jgi:hypothetical protein
MIERPVATGDRARRFCGLSSSSTSSTVILFLFRFPDPRPVVGTVFEGSISTIYGIRGE